MNFRHSCLVAAIVVASFISISAQDQNGSAVTVNNQSSEAGASAQAEALTELRAGTVSFRQKDYENARTHYEKAVALQPDLAAAHYNLGVVLLDTSKFEDAAKSFERASLLDPAAAKTHYYLGFLYSQLRQPQQAAAQYELVISSDSPSPEAFNNLGFAYIDLKRFTDAAKVFARALELKPGFAEATGGLCLVNRAIGLGDEALESCRVAAESNPQSENIQILLAGAYLDTAKYPQALETFRKVLAVHPHEPRILTAAGIAEWKMADYNDALKDFLAAANEQPDSAGAYAGIGVCYYMLKKFPEAQQAFHKAIDLDPDSSVAHANLAMTCMRENMRECALEQYGVLKALAPDLSDQLFGKLFSSRVVDARKLASRGR